MRTTRRAVTTRPRHRLAERGEQRRFLVLPETLLQEGEHCTLRAAERVEAVGEHFLRLAAQYFDRRAVEVTFQDDRVDIALAADGRSVPKSLGHAFDCLHEVSLRFGFRGKAFELLQRQGREHRAGPRAKILGGKFFAGDLANVRVYVIGLHVLLLTVPVNVLKQLLARQILHAAYDGSEPCVVQLDFVAFAALAFEREAQPVALHFHVSVVHRAEPERAVGARVLFVADANQRRLE
jgi:hypothetical protein